jgi:hypothetical protein
MKKAMPPSNIAPAMKMGTSTPVENPLEEEDDEVVVVGVV